jgi:hypothetical protein
MKAQQAQIDAVLIALRTAPITSMQMIRRHGITRLAAIIHQLRQDGYDITTQMLTVRTRRGHSAQVAEYALAKRRRGRNRVAERIDGRKPQPVRRSRARKAPTRRSA